MLTKKLQIKPGTRFVVVNPPDGFDRTLGALPMGAKREQALRGTLDLVLLFARDSKALNPQWPKALACLTEQGMLWIAYPKKSSGIVSDLGMSAGWDVATGSPWQPVAMVAIDDTWSATRFKHSPGLAGRREQRPEENVHDADGTLCIDRRNRVITPPKDLQAMLKKSAKARAFFESLSFTNQREYVQWVIEAKRPETRADRLTKSIEKLSKGRKNPSDK
jgi:hypothetical protein